LAVEQELRDLRVGLLWHSAKSGNLGVGALTVANLALAKAAARRAGFEPRFTILGMREVGPSYIGADEAAQFEIDTRKLLDPRGYWSELSQLDCILDIGAGDSFAEIYGAKRFAFLWLSKFLAGLRGVPLLLSPQTIGPFSGKTYVALARQALQRADVVFARDRQSLAALVAMAPEANALLSIDVAFALPYERPSAIRQAPPISNIGVNVSGLLFNEAVSGRNRFGLGYDYAAVMKRLIAELMARRGVKVHLIAHANHASDDWDDDGRLADALANEFQGTIRAPDFGTPSDAKTYIAGLDFLVAARMHACIAAFSAGTPVVPMAYSRKFGGLFGTLGYEHVVPVDVSSEDEVLAYILRRVENPAEIRERIKSGMEGVEALLDVYRAELEGFFLRAGSAK
jgi:colanic acid/amylovoran biosynthesis protein